MEKRIEVEIECADELYCASEKGFMRPKCRLMSSPEYCFYFGSLRREGQRSLRHVDCLAAEKKNEQQSA